MARTPKKIPPKAIEAWERGDEPTAEKISGLRSRQLRNRLGPPGRSAGPSAGSQPSAATPATPQAQKLVRVAPKPKAAPSSAPPPSPSEQEPTTAEIERVDTREEAEAIYRDVRGKMATADEVRYGSLAEKALAALNRIEQIDKRRPTPPAPDLVQEAIRGQMDLAVGFLLRHTREAAQKLKADRAAFAADVLAGKLSPVEVVARVDAMLGGP